MKKTIVFSDFDGTITFKDSFLVFLLYYFGKRRFFLGIFINLPYLIGYKLRFISNEKAKEKLFRYFFKNENLEQFQYRCDYFSRKIIPTILREKAIQALIRHREQGHIVVIVSASFENYLQNWCKENGFACIATRLETNNKHLTGNFEGKNCYGDEKVKRIRLQYQLEDFEVIYAYGDTKGDLQMLNLAHHPKYKPFH